VLLMAACGLLVLAGLLAIGVWGGIRFDPPPPEGGDQRPSAAAGVLRRYLWYVTVAVGAGVGSGILIAGAGGRLAMRLLAVTAGDAAQGRLTEADETVGEITVGGTIGFVIFVTLVFGAGAGALHLLVRRWLPEGRAGGLAFGALLLVLLATRLDPLRSANPDFSIVGPPWLAVLVFSALVVAHGALVAAIAGRYSRALPLISRRPRTIAAHAPLLCLAPFAPVVLPIAVVGLIVLALSRIRSIAALARSSRSTAIGRIVLAAVVLVALPGFVSSFVTILSDPS
jgi:hypothetical protein